MPTPRLTKEIVDAAIFGFEEQKRRLDAQIAELRGLFPNGLGTARPNPPARKKGGMSAAGRKAIAEAQRKRWAAQTKSAPAPKRTKRKLSAAGKAAIVAALKKRWAAKKAGSTTTKKGAPGKAVAKKGTVNGSAKAE
jgi:hypothetical protein